MRDAASTANRGSPAEPSLAAVDLNRLRWRCRRGLLENDLLLDRFFLRRGASLARIEAEALLRLMELADNDLLDLLLDRRPLDAVLPDGADDPALRALVADLRPSPPRAAPARAA